MYGTLEDSRIETGTSKQQQVDANNDQSNFAGESKRIYSHCHVQNDGNQDKARMDVGAYRRLIVASVICLVFMIAEVVGGVLSNSLAIATDAAHLLTDFASFMISLFSLWLSSRPASRKMSFGWYRAEVIGALLSVLMIWLVTGFIVYMAIERLRTGEFEIDSKVMLITATAGLLVNIIMAWALHGHSHGFHSHHHHHEDVDHDHQHASHEHSRLETVATIGDPSSFGSKNNLIASSSNNRSVEQPSSSNLPQRSDEGRGSKNINVRAAFIHVIGDLLQSFGVVLAALVIYIEPEYGFVDPICTFLFSIIVLITTLNIIKDVVNVLMEGIPHNINFIEVREKLQKLPSVIRVHNLRIWSLSLDKIAISTHLVIDDSRTPSQALQQAIETLKSSYNFFEITIQVEEYREDMKDCEHCQDEKVVVNLVTQSPVSVGSPV